MNREQGERMLALADYLETVPEANFEMDRWFFSWDKPMFWHGPECGTVACAMGHACDMPLFQGLGLNMRIETWEDGSRHGFIRIEGEPSVLDGFEAAVRLFGITDPQAQDLFSVFYETDYTGEEQRGDNSPAGVAGRLREFVKEHATDD